MGNHGQYYVILWGKTTFSGSKYLEYHFNVAQKAERQFLNQLFVQKPIIADNSVKQQKETKESDLVNTLEENKEMRGIKIFDNEGLAF